MSMPDEIVVEDEEVIRGFSELLRIQKAMHYWTSLYLDLREKAWQIAEKKLGTPSDAGYIYFHDTHTFKKSSVVEEMRRKEKEEKKE